MLNVTDGRKPFSNHAQLGLRTYEFIMTTYSKLQAQQCQHDSVAESQLGIVFSTIREVISRLNLTTLKYL